MLFPIGTDRATRRGTVVTPAIIAVTVAAHLALVALGSNDPERADQIRRTFWILGGEGFRWWGLFTHTLLHGDGFHLAGNMVFLWVFGRLVEDKYSRLGFLGLYLAGAAAAAGLHAAFDDAPAIGASGAVAAVSGSFMVLFPRTRVRLFYFFFLIGVVWVPAVFLIGAYLALDVIRYTTPLLGGMNIAVLAHIGGYAMGISLSAALLAARVFQREPYDLVTLISQAKRRREFKEAVHQAERERQRVAAERESPEAAARTDEIARRRALISGDIAAGNLDDAAAAYADLVLTFPAEPAATTLGRDAMLKLGAHLYAQTNHTDAAALYDRFLAAYPRDREAPEIRLLLGRLYALRLDDPARARPLLERAADELADPGHAALAKDALEQLAQTTNATTDAAAEAPRPGGRP